MREGVWLHGRQVSRSGPALVLRELSVVLSLKQLLRVLRVHPGQHWKEPHLSTNPKYPRFEVKSLPDPLPQGDHNAPAWRLAQYSLSVRGGEDQCSSCTGEP